MSAQRGFTYLGLLFAVALFGLLIASAGQVWHKVAQRQREEELLFIGEQFSAALASYRAATPGDIKHWPRRLDELVEDKRGPLLRRHLRKLFVDPMTGHRDWGLVMAGAEITGIYSLGEGVPIKQANFPSERTNFGAARSYQEWRFTGAAEVPPPEEGAGG